MACTLQRHARLPGDRVQELEFVLVERPLFGARHVEHALRPLPPRDGEEGDGVIGQRPDALGSIGEACRQLVLRAEHTGLPGGHDRLEKAVPIVDRRTERRCHLGGVADHRADDHLAVIDEHDRSRRHVDRGHRARACDLGDLLVGRGGGQRAGDRLEGSGIRHRPILRQRDAPRQAVHADAARMGTHGSERESHAFQGWEVLRMFDTATGITEGIRDERAAMRERSMDWRQRRLQHKVEALHDELDREREARRALTDAMSGRRPQQAQPRDRAHPADRGRRICSRDPRRSGALRPVDGMDPGHRRPRDDDRQGRAGRGRPDGGPGSRCRGRHRPLGGR